MDWIMTDSHKPFPYPSGDAGLGDLDVDVILV